MPLLVSVAVYVGDWHEGCKSLARSQLVQIPQTWAAEINKQLEDGAAKQLEGSGTSSLAKQCMYFMYGVLCFGGSAALSANDIATLCKLHILANNCRVFTEDMFTEDKVLEVESSSLHTRCLNVMAGRVRQIVELARVDPIFVTAAV